MTTIILLIGGGLLLLELACFYHWLRYQQTTYLTQREITDFTADIQTWLRSESR